MEKLAAVERKASEYAEERLALVGEAAQTLVASQAQGTGESVEVALVGDAAQTLIASQAQSAGESVEDARAAAVPSPPSNALSDVADAEVAAVSGAAVAGIKRRRGRPRLTEEQKALRDAKRKKLSQQKMQLQPEDRIAPGSPQGLSS